MFRDVCFAQLSFDVGTEFIDQVDVVIYESGFDKGDAVKKGLQHDRSADYR